ncbi:hypothetical protein D3C72_1339760 [compost metagenome]
MTHIGNRHQKTPSLGAADAHRLAIDGIVKIARVLTIDGHQRNIGQVDPVLAVRRAHLVGQLLGKGQALVRKLMRHAILAHGNFDFHAGVVDLAQHLHHAPYRLAEQRRRLSQLDHHHLTGLGRTDGTAGDENVLPVTLVFGGNQPHTAFLQQTADDGVRGTLNDFYNAAFRTAFAISAHDTGADPVAVQYCAHFVGRYVDVALVVIPDHEAVAFTVALDYTFNFF